MASITTTSPDLSRRRLALTLDLILGPVAFFTWAAVGVAVTGSLHSSNNLVNLACGGSPAALWIALLLALAWRGQTPGQALAQLRWVDARGRRARWRPLGEVGFWCAGLYVLAAPVDIAAATVLHPLNVTLNNTTSGLLACSVVALSALIVARQARHSSAARLVRLAR